MTTTRLPEVGCPYCGHRLDAATGAYHDVRPKPGDISICMACANFLVFDADRKPRAPSVVELMEISADPAAQMAMASLKRVKGFK